MRKGFEASFVMDEGNLVGVNFGSDFCAEHEWGISDIRSAFGIESDKIGLDALRVRSVPGDSEFRWIKLNGGEGFIFDDDYSVISAIQSNKSSVLEFHGDNDVLSAAWSGNDFAVIASDEDGKRNLKTIFDAINARDAAILVAGSNNPFGNGGLTILIASKIPAEVVKGWRDRDLEARNIREEWNEEAGTLEEDLRAAGRGWFSLFRRIIRSEDGVLRTWLNPMEQRHNNAGWFSVEDLRQWINGKGPIPIQEK